MTVHRDLPENNQDIILNTNSSQILTLSPRSMSMSSLLLSKAEGYAEELEVMDL